MAFKPNKKLKSVPPPVSTPPAKVSVPSGPISTPNTSNPLAGSSSFVRASGTDKSTGQTDRVQQGLQALQDREKAVNQFKRLGFSEAGARRVAGRLIAEQGTLAGAQRLAQAEIPQLPGQANLPSELERTPIGNIAQTGNVGLMGAFPGLNTFGQVVGPENVNAFSETGAGKATGLGGLAAVAIAASAAGATIGAVAGASTTAAVAATGRSSKILGVSVSKILGFTGASLILKDISKNIFGNPKDALAEAKNIASQAEDNITDITALVKGGYWSPEEGFKQLTESELVLLRTERDVKRLLNGFPSSLIIAGGEDVSFEVTRRINNIPALREQLRAAALEARTNEIQSQNPNRDLVI